MLAHAVTGCGDTNNNTDWRLPNINELHSLINVAQSNPALTAGYPFASVQSDYYWSSTSRVPFGFFITGSIWVVSLVNGDTDAYPQSRFAFHVWPVRGGQ